MNKDELIVKQQLKIEEMETDIKGYEDSIEQVYSLLFSIGAPLNDNILEFSPKQREVLHKIAGALDI